MKKRRILTIIALVCMFGLLFSACDEVEVGESGWTHAYGDPRVAAKPTATEDQLVAFGAYPNTVTGNDITTAFKNIKIDDVTGLWTEEETQVTDKDGNVTSTVVTRYDIQSGYYVREETDAEGNTTVNSYAKEGGKYYLVQEIQWIVLKDLGDNYLLIAREAIDSGRPFVDEFAVSNWAESSIRDWLGGTGDYAKGGVKYLESWNFFDRAFTDSEQQSIAVTKNTTADNDTYKTEGGADTDDKVFFLSAEEFAADFGDALSGQASCTPFAAARGADTEYKTRGVSWWLRTPGINTYFQGVDRNGDFVEGGFASSDTTVGIRPVIVVAKSAVRAIDTTLPTAGPLATATPRPTSVPTDDSANG